MVRVLVLPARVVVLCAVMLFAVPHSVSASPIEYHVAFSLGNQGLDPLGFGGTDLNLWMRFDPETAPLAGSSIGSTTWSLVPSLTRLQLQIQGSSGHDGAYISDAPYGSPEFSLLSDGFSTLDVAFNLGDVMIVFGAFRVNVPGWDGSGQPVSFDSSDVSSSWVSRVSVGRVDYQASIQSASAQAVPEPGTLGLLGLGLAGALGCRRRRGLHSA